MTWTVTTISTITPWAKEFSSRDDVDAWLRSMDIVDGWGPLRGKEKKEFPGVVSQRTILERDPNRSKYDMLVTYTHHLKFVEDGK